MRKWAGRFHRNADRISTHPDVLIQRAQSRTSSIIYQYFSTRHTKRRDAGGIGRPSPSSASPARLSLSGRGTVIPEAISPPPRESVFIFSPERRSGGTGSAYPLVTFRGYHICQTRWFRARLVTSCGCCPCSRQTMEPALSDPRAPVTMPSACAPATSLMCDVDSVGDPGVTVTEASSMPRCCPTVTSRLLQPSMGNWTSSDQVKHGRQTRGRAARPPTLVV